MRSAFLCLLLVPALAGCLGPGGLTGNVDDAFQGGDVELPTTLYLDDDGGLVPDLPATASVPIDWSWGEWFAGTTAPAWAGPSYDRAYIITQATVTVQYDTAGTNAHTDTRPPFTIWFGAGDSIIEHAFADGPNPWSPGDVQTITFDVDSLPVGGLVVESGDQPILHVGHYYGDGQGQERVDVLIGGTDASRIDWTLEPIALPASRTEAVLDTSDSLQGGRCIAPLNLEGSAQADFTFDVPGDAVGINAVLTRDGGDGLGPDMDFYLTGPNGEDVAHAAGSATPEALHLRAPNMDAIGPGTWGVHVYNCQPQMSAFTVQVDVLRAI